ncbi:MAG: DUF899 family protein [Chthoniobacterales bacterium]
MEKEYIFDGPKGKETLANLFEERSQLVVYHFMFAPDWDEGCPHCSFWADNFNGIGVHLNHRDVTMVAISRAPLAKLEVYYNYERFKTDMSDREGASVFYRDEHGNVFHTYSSYSRGIDMLNTAYHYLDLVPKGRDEAELEFTQAWVRYHDKY